MSGVVVLVLRILLALALYAFLALALWMLWQDLRRAAHEAGGRHVPAIRLEIQAIKQPSTFRAFSQPEVILGRDPLCDVPIEDPSVSARHALLSYHHGQWWLDDLGSSNGTRLNHEKLTIPTVLTTGDEIECGRAHVSITLTASGMPQEKAADNGHDF